MRIAIFGGTGKTGQQLIHQALNTGYEVVALARTPAKLATQHPNLTVIAGDATRAEDVEKVVQGASVVISVLGPARHHAPFTITQATTNILDAMRRYDIGRLIISAGAGVRDPQDKPRIIDRIFGFVLGIVSRDAIKDMTEVVHRVRQSDRDWTVVRVPMLTDETARNHLKVGYLGQIETRLTREDMAAFMLRQIPDEAHVRRAPAISN